MSQCFLILLRSFYLFGIFILSSSCLSGNRQNLGENNKRGLDDTPPITRDRPKIPDPKIQAECTNARNRNVCEGDDDCEDICNDIFSSRDKRDCYKLPKDLVSEFETLIEVTEDGKVENIDTDVLRCLLDIDEREFAKAVKKMGRTDSKKFLDAIIEDEHLADVLKSEDDEFNILEQLLYRVTGSNNLADQLGDKIDGKKTIVWLAGEGNDFIWDWLNSYVSEECDSNNADCPGGDNIGAYCNVLLDMSKRNLEDFLSEADLFEDQYQENVEEEYGELEAKFLYEVKDSFEEDEIGDFRDYCRSVLHCGGPENTFRITFETATDAWHGGEMVPRWAKWRNRGIGSAVPIPPGTNDITYYPDSITDSRYDNLLGHIVISFPDASSGREADLSAIVIDKTETDLKERNNSRQYSAEVDFSASQLTKHICFKRSDDSYWSDN